MGILQRLSELIGEQIDDIPDPQRLPQVVEVMGVISDTFYQQYTMEEVIEGVVRVVAKIRA